MEPTSRGQPYLGQVDGTPDRGVPPDTGRLTGRWLAWREADPRRAPVPAVVLGVLALAVVVQVLVWGSAPASGSGGSLLPGLRPAFGTAYAAVLVAAEVALCLWFRLTDAAVTVLVTGAAVDAVLWLAHVAGARFALGAGASMTAAFGAVALAASLWRWRQPASRPRPPEAER